MRDVLTGSVSDLSGSVKKVAGVGGVVRSVLTPMRRVQRSMLGASAMNNRTCFVICMWMPVGGQLVLQLQKQHL